MKGNTLERDGKFIGISETLSLELSSPFFDREEIILANGEKINPRGQVVQEFSKVDNANINALIGHIDKLTLKNQPRETKGWRLLSDGMLIDTGNLQVKSIKPNLNNNTARYSFNFFSGDTSDFLEAVGDKTLKDLVMDGDRFIAAGDISGHRSLLLPRIF